MKQEYQDKIEAGCTRCNTRFFIPVDKLGLPVWTHLCPETAEEKIDKLAKAVEELKASKDV